MMMLADSDMYVLHEDPWNSYKQNCQGQQYWFSSLKGECMHFSDSLDLNLREQIFQCYGLDVIKEMEKRKTVPIYFPFAAKSVPFLKLLWKMNKERDTARLLNFDYISGTKTCSLVNFKILFF